MDEGALPPIGTIMTIENTSDSADAVRDFYSAVMDWEAHPLRTDDYDDYMMATPDGQNWVAGICHRRGPNANQPPGWIPCFRVADLEASLAAAEAQGGKLADEIRRFGPNQRYVVIQDPHGLYVAMMEIIEPMDESSPTNLE